MGDDVEPKSIFVGVIMARIMGGMSVIVVLLFVILVVRVDISGEWNNYGEQQQ